MNQLLRKDIAISLNTILFGLALSCMPYIVFVFYWIGTSSPSDSIDHYATLGHGIFAASMYCAMLNCLAIGLLASSIVSTERRDRTTQFLFFLPPTKVEILFSKFVVCSLFFIATTALFLVAVYCLVPWLSAGEIEPLGKQYLVFVIFGFSIFGCSWFGSCVFQSPQTSALLGVSVPVVAYLSTLRLTLRLWPDIAEEWLAGTALAAMILLGVLGFILGTIAFVRRIAP